MTYGFSDGLDGVMLSDHSLVQVILQHSETLQVGRHQLSHRDAGADGNHIGDRLLVDNHATAAGSPLRLRSVGCSIAASSRSRPSMRCLISPASS